MLDCRPERARIATSAAACVVLLVAMLPFVAGGGSGDCAGGCAFARPVPFYSAPPDTILSIAEVRAPRPNSSVPAALGDTVSVRGRVSAGTGVLPDSSLVFLQDRTGGVAVRLPDGPAVSRGDSLWVEGVVEQEYGLTRLNASDVGRVNAMMRAPEPVLVTVAAAASEQYEGRLVRVLGTVVVNRANDGGRYLLVEGGPQDDPSRLAVFAPRRRTDEIDLGSFAEGERVDITGVLSQYDRTAPYDAAYQVLPRDKADLEGGDDEFGYYPTIILILVGGALVGAVVVFTLRVTVRRRTQQLAESRARFRRLAEATAEGIILHRDECVLDVNRALVEMTGYSRNELVGRSLDDVLSASTWAPDPESGRDEEGLCEAVVVRKDGTSFPAEIERRRVEAGGQRVEVVALRNVTTRKQRERELLLAKKEAERMARLKSSLLNNMSHEFRTPITSILGYAELIREEPEADHDEFARRIQRSGKRLSRTLRAVLEMAQLEADTVNVQPQQVPVGSLVQEVVERHRSSASKNGVSISIAEADPCAVWTDEQLLRRVVDALVDNAQKFTEEGEVEVAYESRGEGVRIAVRDPGIGIDPEFRSNLFVPFAQESNGRTRTHEGTGLGLSLAKRFTDLLGGTIEVESEKGRGSTFAVSVPSLRNGERLAEDE